MFALKKVIYQLGSSNTQNYFPCIIIRGAAGNDGEIRES